MKNKLSFILILVLGIAIGYFAFKITSKPNQTFIQAKQKQDSLIIKRDTVIKEIVRYSQQNANKGKELIKQLPNEKTIVPDTTYNAKWEYIQSYSPNKVLP